VPERRTSGRHGTAGKGERMTWRLRTVDEISAAFSAAAEALHRLGAAPEFTDGYLAALAIISRALNVPTDIEPPMTLEIIANDNGRQTYRITS